MNAELCHVYHYTVFCCPQMNIQAISIFCYYEHCYNKSQICLLARKESGVELLSLRIYTT